MPRTAVMAVAMVAATVEGMAEATAVATRADPAMVVASTAAEVLTRVAASAPEAGSDPAAVLAGFPAADFAVARAVSEVDRTASAAVPALECPAASAPPHTPAVTPAVPPAPAISRPPQTEVSALTAPPLHGLILAAGIRSAPAPRMVRAVWATVVATGVRSPAPAAAPDPTVSPGDPLPSLPAVVLAPQGQRLIPAAG